MNILNRRGFIKSAATAAAAAVPTATLAFAGPASPPPTAPAAPSEMPEWWKRLTAKHDDPVIALCEEWRRASEEWKWVEDDSPEYRRLIDKQERLAQAISKTPARTKDGLIAQIEWLRDDLGYYITEMVDDSYATVFDVLIDSLKAEVA